MPSRPIRWGIVGTGCAATTFAADLALLPDAEVVGVASRTMAAACRFARLHDVAGAYSSLTALLADDAVDIVYIATPNAAHRPEAMACIETGKAVLCEKPIAVNAMETQQLVDAARTHGVLLMEAMWMACNPAIRRVLEIIASGAIGSITAVTADLGFRERHVDHWHMDNGQGGGALLDLGTYGVWLAQLVLGEPERATAWSRLTAGGVDINTAMLLGFSEAVAVLSCSYVADTACRATISGSCGRIELPHDFTRPASFEVHRHGEDVWTERVPWGGDGYVHEAAEAMRCLREGAIESPLLPWGHSLAVMRTLDVARSQIGVRYPADGAVGRQRRFNQPGKL